MVVVALYVSLVHAVQSVVVEHRIHLSLTRIVAGTNGVHIGLFHQNHVAKHSLHIDGVTIEWVNILGVDTLEEYSLAVYINQFILDGHLSETVFGREYHLFLVASLLANDNGIEVRLL